MANVNVTIRMDSEIKHQADELFADLGLTMSSAVTVFIRQAIREQAVPFYISRDVPNSETIQAIEEVQRLKNSPDKKVYDTFRDFMNDMAEEDDDV